MTQKITEVQPPQWFLNDLALPFKAGTASVFIVHGQTNCLIKNPQWKEDPAKPYFTLREFWEYVFADRSVFIRYDIASGLSFPHTGMAEEFIRITGATRKELPQEPELCLPLIEKALQRMDGVACVIESAHFLVPPTHSGFTLPQNERIAVQRIKKWAQDGQMRARGNIVILLTEQEAKISQELRGSDSGIQTAYIPKPSKEERKNFVSTITRKSKGENSSPLTFSVPRTFDLEAFVLDTQGLGLRQIMDLFLEAKKAGENLATKYVKKKKAEILNFEYGDVMEVEDPQSGLEGIGGLDHLKAYLQTNVIEAMERGEAWRVPMGIMLVGPPGTGKTATVSAMAKDAGFNFVRVKNLRSMWQGETEAKAEKLLSGLRSLAPVAVINDEADLSETDRDAPKGDSGVSDRLMKMWMEFLSDTRNRGQVLVVHCSNRPDKLDAAYKRSGRTDEIILVPMPSRAELTTIFPIVFKRHKIPTQLTDFSVFADMTDGRSGADVEKISLKAWRIAAQNGKGEVDEEILKAAIEDTIPSASQATIDQMTIFALRECSSRSLLPPHIKEIVRGIKERDLIYGMDEILADLKARGIVDGDEDTAARVLVPNEHDERREKV